MIKEAPENQAAKAAPENKAGKADEGDPPEGYVCVIEEPLREAAENAPPNIYEDTVDHELEDAMGLGDPAPNPRDEDERDGPTVVVAKPVGRPRK